MTLWQIFKAQRRVRHVAVWHMHRGTVSGARFSALAARYEGLRCAQKRRERWCKDDPRETRVYELAVKTADGFTIHPRLYTLAEAEENARHLRAAGHQFSIARAAGK